MIDPFYEAWMELDALDEFLGIEPVKWPMGCTDYGGRAPAVLFDCARRRPRQPCSYCVMVDAHGRPPGSGGGLVVRM